MKGKQGLVDGDLADGFYFTLLNNFFFTNKFPCLVDGDLTDVFYFTLLNNLFFINKFLKNYFYFLLREMTFQIFHFKIYFP